MTPSLFNEAIVTTRLTLLGKLVADVSSASPVTASELEADWVKRLAMERAITQMVEISVDVATHILASTRGVTVSTYAEAFQQLGEQGVIDAALAASLERAARMRNLLTHVYMDIDVEQVAAAVPRAVDDFSIYGRTIATWLLSTNEGSSRS